MSDLLRPILGTALICLTATFSVAQSPPQAIPVITAETIEPIPCDTCGGGSFQSMPSPLGYGNVGYGAYSAGGWRWEFLPSGLMYRSYLAGGREPRFASQWVLGEDQGWLWDVTLGGRVGILRYGTQDALWPEGWQLDIEGAAFPRLDLERGRDMVASDFRFGIPLTLRQGRWEGKLSYYHLSSHLADEFIAAFPGATRINYVRDAVELGIAFRPTVDWRLYTEAEYAFDTDGGSEPWEFQFGVEYSPLHTPGCFGAPFLAVDGRIRQEVDFGGGLTVQSGLQWRGRTGQLFRVGAHYFNGKTDQAQFFGTDEELLGLGVWYDY